MFYLAFQEQFISTHMPIQSRCSQTIFQQNQVFYTLHQPLAQVSDSPSVIHRDLNI